MAERKKTSWLGLVAVVIFAIVVLSMCINKDESDTKEVARSETAKTASVPSSSGREPSTSTARDEPRDIKASVSFDGAQFKITNRESRAWTNVRFEINPGILSSGYTLKVARIETGATYTVGAMQFANSKGERFNPFQQKPKEFHILEFARPWPDQYELEGMAIFGWN